MLREAAAVVICGDPGGARAVLPVVQRLGRRGVEVRSFPYHQARAIFEDAGVACSPIPPDASAAWLSEVVARNRCLLTGTSANGVDWEKNFIRAARSEGIPSITVLDYWSAYAERFSASELLDSLPDAVAAMDERARREAMEAGIPEDRILVAGQPAFEELEDRAAAFTEHSRRDMRARMGAAPEDLLVVFASQPFRALRGREMGFTEEEVLDSLVVELERIARSGRGVRLIVRPHPRESLTRESLPKHEAIRADVSSVEDRIEAALAADLVVGMNSVYLVEACRLGRPAVSYQPGLIGRDTLPTNESGESFAAYRREDLRESLARALASGPRSQARGTGRRGSEIVGDWIEERLRTGPTSKEEVKNA